MMKNRRSKSLKDSTPNPDSRDMKTTANDNFINISFKYFRCYKDFKRLGRIFNTAHDFNYGFRQYFNAKST